MSNAYHIGSIKQGTTFSLPVKVRPFIYNTPVVDLTGWVIKSQLRQSEKLIDNLLCEFVNISQGLALITAGASMTANWPAVQLSMDIKMTSPDGISVVTSTMTLLVEKAITI